MYVGVSSYIICNEMLRSIHFSIEFLEHQKIDVHGCGCDAVTLVGPRPLKSLYFLLQSRYSSES